MGPLGCGVWGGGAIRTVCENRNAEERIREGGRDRRGGVGDGMWGGGVLCVVNVGPEGRQTVTRRALGHTLQYNGASGPSACSRSQMRMEESMAAVTRREQAAVMGIGGRWGFKKSSKGNQHKNPIVSCRVAEEKKRKENKRRKKSHHTAKLANSSKEIKNLGWEQCGMLYS